ncbi:MAG: hypothetical protein AAF554_01915 [Bacteroidota bacterium]
MKNNPWIRCGLFLVLLLCSNAAIGQQEQSESTEKIQTAWLEALKDSEGLEAFYTAQSGIMLNDELHIGAEEIKKQLLAFTEKVGQFKQYTPLETHQLRDNEKFVAGTYETTKGNTLSSITGWKNQGKWKKVFEVVYEKTACDDLGENAVNQGRELWEKHSNTHRPDLIVKEVFSKNGKYFNRGILYKGLEISNAYSYMNDESYNIKLESLYLSQINCDIIYDIGTFEVGGKGLYTLIWQKETDDWKLLLDFNF